MKSFGEMVAETQSQLRSWVRDQEISTHLTKPLAVDAKRLPVADVSVLSRGRVEIDDELIWVDRPQKSANEGEIPPYGRGMDGTLAAPHEAGTRVIIAPLYPRKFLKDTLNQTIRQIGATLYGVEDLSITLKTYRDFKYELPKYVRDVLTVKVSDARWYNDVTFLRDWTFDKNAPLSTSSTGKALYLYDQEWVGSNIGLTVTVSRDPIPLMNDTDMFSETMLPESAEDIPVLGAAARLLASSDSYEVQSRAVEANTLDSKVSGGAAQQQSKYLQALYMQRLDEERMRLLNQTNNRTRYQR